MYHVMARGDRREAIAKDDEDRRTFLQTLGEERGAAEKADYLAGQKCRSQWGFLAFFPRIFSGFDPVFHAEA